MEMVKTISDSMSPTRIPKEVSTYHTEHVRACEAERTIAYNRSMKNASVGQSDFKALEGEGSMLFQNAVNQLLTDTLSYSRRMESSTTML
jgi:hypothetical protein